MQLAELHRYMERREWRLADVARPDGWNVHRFQMKLSKDGKAKNKCGICGNAEPHAMHTGRFAEYIDSGWSGAKAKRPEMDRLMNDARKREFDAVLVWKLDRWGRSVYHLSDSLRELKAHRVAWIATTQNLDTSEDSISGTLLLNVLAAVAEFERAMIADRVKSGMMAARHKGKKCGRPKAVFDRRQALELHNAGMSGREICARLKIGKGTLHRLIAGR